MTREARLKSQYASRYPNIEADVWSDARALAEQLRTRKARLYGDGLDARQRLDDEHFEFRGGTPRSASPTLAQSPSDSTAA